MKFKLPNGTVITAQSVELAVILLTNLGYDDIVFVAQGFKPDTVTKKTVIIEVIREN